MNTGDEFAGSAQLINNSAAHTSHQPHIDRNIRTVGKFNTNVGDWGANWAHGEWHYIHCSAAHATIK